MCTTYQEFSDKLDRLHAEFDKKMEQNTNRLFDLLQAEVDKKWEEDPPSDDEKQEILDSIPEFFGMFREVLEGNTAELSEHLTGRQSRFDHFSSSEESSSEESSSEESSQEDKLDPADKYPLRKGGRFKRCQDFIDLELGDLYDQFRLSADRPEVPFGRESMVKWESGVHKYLVDYKQKLKGLVDQKERSLEEFLSGLEGEWELTEEWKCISVKKS